MAGAWQGGGGGKLAFACCEEPHETGNSKMGWVSEKSRGLCFGGVSVPVCAGADLAGLLGCVGKGATRETT